MKQMKISIFVLLIFTLLTGVIYPLVITGIGRVFFNGKVNGSLVIQNGHVAGSELIAQNFDKPYFFHGRPSSVNYDSACSGGSNLGPADKKFIEGVKSRALLIRNENNPAENQAVPSDLVFASGSGLDPHISMDAAIFQSGRIASARKMDVKELMEIINANCEKQFYFYGTSYVNVLKLNLAINDKGNLK